MAKGKKSSLKAALTSQQSRLKKKKQAQQAEQVAEQKGKKPKGTKGKERAPPLRSTIPFRPTDKILLIGEGNFSFAHAIAVDPPEILQHLPRQNLYATAYDSEEECYSKYPESRDCVENLRAKGVHVLFNVDATQLEKCSALKGQKFDRIVWNFPHAGKGITDQDRNILSNQLLLVGFLRSAANFLTKGPVPQVVQSRPKKRKGDEDEDEDMVGDDAPDLPENISARGTVLITLRNVPPYTQWDLPRLAKKPPPPQSIHDPSNPHYTLLRSFTFRRSDWKSYEHRMTKGERAHGLGKTGEGGEDRTWEFCINNRPQT